MIMTRILLPCLPPRRWGAGARQLGRYFAGRVAPWTTADKDAYAAPPAYMYSVGAVDVKQLDSSSDEVRRIFSLDFCRKRERNKVAMAEMVQRFQCRPGDTGSPPVQIGTLTLRIQRLTEYMTRNKKDYNGLRLLVQLVHRRRRLLQLLSQSDPSRHELLLADLKIRRPTHYKYPLKPRKH